MNNAFAWNALKSSEERRLYGAIRRAIEQGPPAVPLGDTDPETFSRVFGAVLKDGPGLFQADGKWRIAPNEGRRYAVLHIAFTPEEIRAGRREMADIAARFAPLMERSVPERIRAVFDWLLENTSYGFTETDGQNSYDALIRRRAVCKGISKAFQYLMDSLGVCCTLAEGTLDGVGRHVWNVVEIDGAFYHVDLCMGYRRFDGLFEGTGRSGRYRCFLVGDETLGRTHRRTEGIGPRIICTADYGRRSL